MLSDKYKNFLKLVIYQIYPRSFADSNHDGIGDINGITAKLDYLKDLGVNALWICPCYKSPNDDNGYDISDYRDIMDEFGTLEDIKKLIYEAHLRDIKIIMDFVPNHTSSQHYWFKESRKSKDNPYSDYYYWADKPLNDWKSCFGGSAWEYCPERGQYYLHSYAVSQPDLNWQNPNVVKEMKDVVDFWVSLGADGFRCDVIDQISKDFEQGNNSFGPHLHEYIHDLFGRKETEGLFTVGECWCDTIDEVCRHAKDERGELSTLFQFDHIECGRKDKFTPKKDSLASVRDILIKWQKLADENDLIYSLFTDNHDNSYFVSRIANDTFLRYESATCIAAMFYLLKGVPFIYQGQEFGMTAAHYSSIEKFNDIESKNIYNEFCKTMKENEALEKVNFGSRDNTRHPMAWDSSKYGGFSDVTPWIVPHDRQKEINYEMDVCSEKSVFNFYKRLLNFRKGSNAVLFGDFIVHSKKTDSFFIYERRYGTERIGVICNFEIESIIDNPFKDWKIVLSNHPENDTDNTKFQPYKAVIYKLG